MTATELYSPLNVLFSVV